MGHNRRTPNSHPGQFRTPDKPASPSSTTKLKRAPARLGSLVDIPATVPGSASLAASSTARFPRKSSGLSGQEQSTLTQIDFVKRSQNYELDEDDTEFGYIGEAGENTARNAQDVIEIADNEDNTLAEGGDVDYRPPTTIRPKRTHGVKFQNVSAIPKRTSGDNDGSSKKGRRKSSDKKDKGPQKDDKTLTQMNYVKRIVLDPDEELKMEYAYITPKKKKKKKSGRQAIEKREANDVQQEISYSSEPSSQNKKRKLSLNPPFKEPQDQTKVVPNASWSPATQRKTVKTEIPSSQSPESPGVAFITSSQFRHNTRSPQARGVQTFDPPDVKEGFLNFDRPDEVPEGHIYYDVKPSQLDAKSPLPLQAQRKQAELTLKTTHTEHQVSSAISAMPNSQPRPSSTHRTVIYETDADTDYSDFEDDLPNIVSSPHQRLRSADDQARIGDAHNSLDIESQELPPPPLPEQEIDLGSLLPESALLSDASIMYQRIHAATQFPLDPVPTINTQKMAELFPDDSNGLHSLTAPSQPSTPMNPPSVPNATESQKQNESQDPSESQRAGNQTEVVPESSPVAQHESPSRLDPAVRGVVVQVESSQPVDWIQRRRTEGQDAACRGVLSRSQLLSSSVMESVPIPAFWMSSQDSVGEPYALPET
ncbi:hypothetical protein BJX64DRAFT_263095 [Aspergillus heterothallicus]